MDTKTESLEVTQAKNKLIIDALKVVQNRVNGEKPHDDAAIVAIRVLEIFYGRN